METIKSPQRIDSGIDLSADEAPASNCLLQIEAFQLLNGLTIILEYLNAGNSLAEVNDIKRRSFNWCRNYYGTVFYQRHTPEVVIDAHPCLFYVDVPSLLRLDRPRSYTGDDDAMEQDGCEQNKPGKDEDYPFPGYSEPVLLSDSVMYHLLELHDVNVATRELVTGEYMVSRDAFSMRITAVDLKESPIIFHIPEVMCNLSLVSTAALMETEMADAEADQPTMDIDDEAAHDTDQVMQDCQAQVLKAQGGWGLLSSLIGT